MQKKTEDRFQAAEDEHEIVIPKEKAVFWMDKNGHWYNEGGRFELKKVINRFNTSIQKDSDGYFLTQINGNKREKIYFPYEDTALFAIDLQKKDAITLRLNTGKRLPLFPDSIYLAGESLYTLSDDDWIKFSERSLLKLSAMIDWESDPYTFHYRGKVHPIHKKP